MQEVVVSPSHLAAVLAQFTELLEIGQKLLVEVERLLKLVTKIVSLHFQGGDALLIIEDIVVELDVLKLLGVV